jgi:hypothetical protein
MARLGEQRTAQSRNGLPGLLQKMGPATGDNSLNLCCDSGLLAQVDNQNVQAK